MTNIDIQVLGYDGLRDLLYGGETESHTTVEPDIPYWRGLGHITYSKAKEHFFVAAVERLPTGEQKVVGIMEMQMATVPGVIWLMSIGVAPTYRQRGIANEMCRRMCTIVQKMGLILESSTLSDDGKKYLKPALVRAVRASGVAVHFSQEHWYA